MNARRGKWWWVGGLVLTGLVMLGLGRFLASRGLEDADRWASVLGLFLNVGALLLAIYTVISGRGSRLAGTVRNSITDAQISGPVLMGRDLRRVSLSGAPQSSSADQESAGAVPAAGSEPVDTESRVEGGTIGGALIMARDLQDVVLPAQPPPVLPAAGHDENRVGR